MPAPRPSLFRSRLVLALVVSSVVALAAIALDPKGLRRSVALGAAVTRLDTENAKLTAEVEALQKQALALEGDPSALERAARENGYVEDGELLFELR